MKWYNLIYKEVAGTLNEIYDWEDVFIFLIVIPFLAPIAVVCSVGVGMFGLMRLTLDPKSYEALGVSSRNALMGLVLLLYACVGIVVLTGTYMAVVSLFERFVG